MHADPAERAARRVDNGSGTDQRLCTDGRRTPMRPPPEEPGLDQLRGSTGRDCDDPPGRWKHEDREREGDKEDHAALDPAVEQLEDTPSDARKCR